jgi:DNA polymerase/3'-5' exonuclease PolX
MRLARAEQIARTLADEMSPHCSRVEIAGSIRRGCPEVKDIELVAVPTWKEEETSEGLFAEQVQVNLLHRWAERSGVHWIKPGTSQIVPWHVKEDGKYWRGLLPTGIKLDLFIADSENFGLIFAIRTGSAEFTTALVTRARDLGLPSVDGYLTRGGERVATPEERDVFELLRLEWIDPGRRHSFGSLVRKVGEETAVGVNDA